MTLARYLVTGGCGFIGSHLAAALVERGHDVRILDDLSTGRREHAPKEAELLVGDVRDPDSVARAMADVDGCYHLAAIASVERCHADWRAAHDVNLGGTITVLDAARRARSGEPVPVVYASSAAVYGDQTKMPLDEAAEPRPQSAYAVDKLGCEMHAAVATEVFGLSTVGLRFFNVYGPRQDPASPYSGVISIFAARAMAGEPLTIFGDGEQTRDFIYVGDVVRCLIATMRRCTDQGAEIFNVCTGKATTVNKLAAMICELTGRHPAIHHAPPRVGDVRLSIGDPGRAMAAFGFAPEIDLAAGLERTLDWLAEQSANSQ